MSPGLRGVIGLGIGLIGIIAAALASAGPAAAAQAQREWITTTYERPASADLAKLAATLRTSKVLERWADRVTHMLAPIKEPLAIAFAQCGIATAIYDPALARVTLCYEEAERSFATLKSTGLEGDGLVSAWVGVLLYQVYHEFCHALIDVLDLPAVGREEDACDQFAVAALLGHPSGEDLVRGNIAYFRQMAEIEDILGNDPSARHAFTSQRHFNLLCWLYGFDPEGQASVVDSGSLPEERAKNCPAEYHRAARAWRTLLGPFMRTDH